jgi:hypothetical protein
MQVEILIVLLPAAQREISWRNVALRLFQDRYRCVTGVRPPLSSRQTPDADWLLRLLENEQRGVRAGAQVVSSYPQAEAVFAAELATSTAK